MKIELSNFYTLGSGSQFGDESDRFKYFKGFDTEEEARAWAKSINDDFIAEYDSYEDYLNDITSKSIEVISGKELIYEYSAELSEFIANEIFRKFLSAGVKRVET